MLKIIKILPKKKLNVFFYKKRFFSCSLFFFGNQKKPNLTIDTKPRTGNKGLDSEKEWREKSAFCEHNFDSYYQADENDIKDPILCDFSFEETQKQTIQDKSTKPIKHPAVEGDKDIAYTCSSCFAVVCKQCVEDYPTEANTPNSQLGFTEEKNSPNNNTKANEKNTTSNNNDNSFFFNTEKTSKPKPSNLDDFADTSCEPADYIGGDD